MIASVAETTMAMYFTPDEELKAEAEQLSNKLARGFAKESLAWKAEESADVSTRITNDAYQALYKALVVGEK